MRGNTQGARKFGVDVENQPRMRRISGGRVRQETSQEQVGSDEDAKRRWEKSGMAWMKKRNDRRMWNGYGKLADEGGDDKRRWEKFLVHEQKMTTVELHGICRCLS